MSKKILLPVNFNKKNGQMTISLPKKKISNKVLEKIKLNKNVKLSMEDEW